MIVLDASVVVELLTRTRLGAMVARRIAPARESLHAPHLLRVEVSQALRRLVATRVVGASEAERALADLVGLDIARYAHDPLLSRIWGLRTTLTAHDACYVALAEALDAVLLTADARLARAPGTRARIELIASA